MTNLDEKNLDNLAVKWCLENQFNTEKDRGISYKDGYRQAFADQQKKIEKLKKQLEVCRVALEFYADHRNQDHGFTFDSYEQETCFVNEDDFEEIEKVEPNEYHEHPYLVYGKRARQALKELEKMK